jgi:hypothetical protein
VDEGAAGGRGLGRISRKSAAAAAAAAPSRAAASSISSGGAGGSSSAAAAGRTREDKKLFEAAKSSRASRKATEDDDISELSASLDDVSSAWHGVVWCGVVWWCGMLGPAVCTPVHCALALACCETAEGASLVVWCSRTCWCGTIASADARVHCRCLPLPHAASESLRTPSGSTLPHIDSMATCPSCCLRRCLPAAGDHATCSSWWPHQHLRLCRTTQVSSSSSPHAFHQHT